MKKLITEKEIIQLIKSGKNELVKNPGDLLTPLALDRIRSSGIVVVNSLDKKVSKSSLLTSGSKAAVGCDHTGVKAKQIVIAMLKSKGIDLIDTGTFTEDSVDYPDYAEKVAKTVQSGETKFGIILDATGIPSAITANKFKGIRAATCYNEFSARSSREHNNANILVLGAKSLGDESIKSIVETWLNSEFLSDRHQKRLDKISAIEERNFK